MEEEKSMMEKIATESYDAAGKPFDYVEEGTDTALLCETDAAIKDTIKANLQTVGYLCSEAPSVQEALRFMRFHVYQLIVVNENFDVQGTGVNEVLAYLESLPMSIRRNIFVVLLSTKHRTNDSMAAFNRSVNLIVNVENINDAAVIIRKGITENEEFYRVYRDTMKKFGKI